MNMINKNKKVLIIGGSGFLGSNISKILLKRNYIVTIWRPSSCRRTYYNFCSTTSFYIINN